MRQIYQVTCSQIITSENHPEGLLSSYPDYPKNFDSRSQKATADNPNGNDELALLAAQADYATRVAALATADNASRVGWTVSIMRASDGRQLALKSWGAFPDMTPQPEPEPEEE